MVLPGEDAVITTYVDAKLKKHSHGHLIFKTLHLLQVMLQRTPPFPKPIFIYLIAITVSLLL